MKTVGERTRKEALTPAQRGGELVSTAAMLLVFAFLVSHQVMQTGFFTAKFGAMEMVCLYGPILLSVAAPIVRAITGRRNPGRPFEVATNVFLALAAFWLLLVFPFNFTHLADVLPTTIRFVLAWISNDIGRVVLILQVIVGTIWAGVTAVKYLSVHRQVHATPPATAADRVSRPDARADQSSGVTPLHRPRQAR
jgi:hypothetical protein